MSFWHIALHKQPAELPAGPAIRLEGREWPTLLVSPAQLGEPFALSFEEVADLLESLPRMFFEPDGSFVWVSSASDGSAEQVDGVLYDRAGKALYLELKGAVSPAALDSLLASLGTSPEAAMVQLVQQAVFLSAVDFRHLLAA